MREPRPLTPARLTALAIFTLAMLSLRAQFDVSRGLMGNASIADTLWRMAGYFTVLSNAVVAVAMGAVAMNWRIGPRLAAGLVVWMVLTGVVYHLLLSGLWTPRGIAWWADQGLHTAVPVLVVLWWLLFAPKQIALCDSVLWLIWPAAYAAYAVIRGGMTGFWAYPFLDAGSVGWGSVAFSLAGMLAAVAVGGAALVALARRLV